MLVRWCCSFLAGFLSPNDTLSSISSLTTIISELTVLSTLLSPVSLLDVPDN